MALQELTGGECGTRNPLQNVASHFTQDKGFRQEFSHPLTSITRAPEDEMVREFLADIHSSGAPGRPKTIHMGELLQEMRELEKHDSSIQPGPNVAYIAVHEDNKWADEFLSSEKHVVTSVSSSTSWGQEFLDQPHFMAAGPDYLAEWENQWDDLASNIEVKPALEGMNVNMSKTATEVVNAMSDPKFAQSEFLQFVKKISEGDVSLSSELRGQTSNYSSSWADEFLNSNSEQFDGVIEQAQSSSDKDWVTEFDNQNSRELADQWAKDFTGAASAEVFQTENDFWSRLQGEWEKAAEENPEDLGWLKENLSSDTSVEYNFEKENPYQDQTDPFNMGLQKRAEGDLPEAILFFEAALQKDAEHMKAWEMLGLTLAENEQDPGAIAAYKQCLNLEPSNLTAIMGLAVSYTNESYQLQACKALEDWLKKNAKYAHLVSSDGWRQQQSSPVSSLMSSDLFNYVQDMYLRAARLQPTANLDPDVQTGLGVLLNLSSDFDKAADCFRAALLAKPDDAQLWNRLGATLANGNRSEEAVEAYYKALELSPGFIRARYNLAVSCINLGAHREATEHLVSALLLQSKRSKHVMSDNIWSTLRMVLNLMNRRDFLVDIENRDLTRLAQEFGVPE
nr:EOG090X054E [Cyclestheria hislopi]